MEVKLMNDIAIRGMMISGVNPDTAWARAGIIPGDRIIFVNGERVFTLTDYLQACKKRQSGSVRDITLIRGMTKMIDVTM